MDYCFLFLVCEVFFGCYILGFFWLDKEEASFSYREIEVYIGR